MAPLRLAQVRTRPRRPEIQAQDISDPNDPGQEEEGEGGIADHTSDDDDDDDDDEDSEPPQKRLRTSRKSSARSRWVPGGRGGGGRRIDTEESAPVPVTPVAPDNNFPAPRSRRRDTSRRTTTTSRSSARSRNRGATRPRYSTAAAASAAAAAHGDGYKPREERGWEEFHPDLDLDSTFAIISSGEVDGLINPTLAREDGHKDDMDGARDSIVVQSPARRRPGRPQRTRDSMLQALMIPEQPKIIPRPGPNPRERLTLPKPSYRILDPFLSYEQKDIAAVNFVNQAMANVGYQESELYIRPDRVLIRQLEGSAEEDLDLSPSLQVAGTNSAIGSTGVGRVEYDMDEQDVKWLEAFNKTRADDGIALIKPAIFEITMTKIEKEWHALEKRIPKPNPKAPQTQRPRSSSAAAVNGEPGNGEEPDSKCAICDDGDCENANAIVFCDGCDLAVHQECYGVPYIPEGQWLCRKCQLVGNARPSCIFCPNEGGAFKQTNNSKWAHLLCATWIPEVTIGNPSLMEPITDVEKVPNSRWKLHCYICRQDMGASIQCSDGRCYEAFHLTCARQAGLYLKMKIGGGQNTLMDSSHLRAYCHRHTPADWRAEHHTDKAFEHAVKYFKVHFQGQIWADSRASALAITEPPETPQTASGSLKMTLTNRKGQKPKTIWRLPSGAPVIPEVILKSIEESLLRFGVPKKKEYVAEVCKYWTLKREARRGAALLKRLQLQMDTFSSFEVTRRDYKAQGAAGRARLERRIAFAENLAKDLDRIRTICELIKQREAEKLQEAALLKDVVDIIYFPIPSVLIPVLDRAMKLDPKGVYHEGLSAIRGQLNDRQYSSVAAFSSDFAKVFMEDLGFDATKQENLSALYSRPALTSDVEQRERRTLARRIVKAVQPALEDALKQETELTGRPFAQQMKEMDDMLFSRRQSMVDSFDVSVADTPTHVDEVHVADTHASPHDQSDEPIVSSVEAYNKQGSPLTSGDSHSAVQVQDVGMTSKAQISSSVAATTPPGSTNGINRGDADVVDQHAAPLTNGLEPPTPPMSTRDQSNLAQNGHLQSNDKGAEGRHVQRVATGNGVEPGIPWYVQQFDPEGTTIWEERWMGQDVLRDMSEELSEMDEDELDDLDTGAMSGLEDDSNAPTAKDDSQDDMANDPAAKKSAVKKASKRRKAHMWSERSYRIRR